MNLIQDLDDIISSLQNVILTTNSLKDIQPLHADDVPLHQNNHSSIYELLPSFVGETAPFSKKRRCFSINQLKVELKSPTGPISRNHGAIRESLMHASPDTHCDEENLILYIALKASSFHTIKEPYGSLPICTSNFTNNSSLSKLS